MREKSSGECRPGDMVRITTAEKTFTGILMPTPSYEGNTVVLKLDNGYNIGIRAENIVKMEVVETVSRSREEKAEPPSQRSELPRITILHTGGTIASKVDYKTGGVIARFTPEELLRMFPELSDIAQVDSRLLRNMWSDDMRFEHYNLMAEAVSEELKKKQNGVIITHGTDTLHYTSAALSFILEELSVPVILVGAQRSSDRGSSDAALNLLNAAYFISNSDFAGVGICMHENLNDSSCLILPGCKTRKMHTSRRDTFRPINTQPVARVNYTERRIEFMSENYKKKGNPGIKLKPLNPKIRVGILKSHPHMYSEEIKAYSGFDGLVLEGTGLGHMPISCIDEFTGEHNSIRNAIAELVKSGTIVVMAPQTIYGRINMDVYAPGRELQEIGVTGNQTDMTPETAFIKLAWLLSSYPKNRVPELFSKNLRGELGERTPEQDFAVD